MASTGLALTTAASSAALAGFYYGAHVSGAWTTAREKSWLLTAFSSAVMTLVSIPYLAEWYRTGMPGTGDRHFADHACAFFAAYLICDLTLGSIHYRSQISIMTGWFHHIAYLSLIRFTVIPHGYAPLFALGSILELPTLLLAAGNLQPRLRNDYLFAAVFFATRLALDAYLALSHVARGAHFPALIFALTLPMHALWMRDCVRGILRRRRIAAAQAAAAARDQSSAATLVIAQPPLGLAFVHASAQRWQRLRSHAEQSLRARRVPLTPAGVHEALLDARERVPLRLRRGGRVLRGWVRQAAGRYPVGITQ